MDKYSRALRGKFQARKSERLPTHPSHPGKFSVEKKRRRNLARPTPVPRPQGKSKSIQLTMVDHLKKVSGKLKSPSSKSLNQPATKTQKLITPTLNSLFKARDDTIQENQAVESMETKLAEVVPSPTPKPRRGRKPKEVVTPTSEPSTV
jgi:hypothetical protein